MKSLMKFEHINASTIDEAVSLLRQYGDKAWVNAGGTDLIGAMRFEVLRDYPEILINLKTIPGLDYIKEEDGLLKIGALTRLEDIANHATTKNKYSALAEAAHRTASPHVRAMGTIGGNICQLIRCWYFRKEDNRFDCIRKGGAMCHAVAGDNRYHSIFGGVRVAESPCSAGCPASNDIPSYLSSIRESDLPKAAELLLGTNPLAAITGRVCPHNCEKECNRAELDESISIRSVERFVGDYILANVDRFFKPPQTEISKKIAVIGSGPAGLTAAYYLRKLGYAVTVFETMEEAGGILTYGIPPYRLPKDAVRNQIKALESTGIEFKLRVNIGEDLTLEELRRDFDAVFCATGAWKQAPLRIQDEELLTSGLEFLTQVNSGLRKILAKRVLVIGGGSVAMDVATCARRLGAEQVIVACLESKTEMPALPEEVEQALKEGITLMPSWGPSRVLTENGMPSGIELIRCTAVYDSQHKFAPEYDRNIKEVVKADKIILAIGQRPDLSYAESLIEMNRGLIKVDPDTQATDVAKVFAGGDATTSGPLSVVAAVASGHKAATAINQYLQGNTISDGASKVEHLERYIGEDFEILNRVEVPELPLSQLSLDSEDVLGLELSAVETESRRCLNCGCDGVNPSDTAAALVALDARIVTTRRTIKADEFWAAERGLKPTILENDEIITEIQIPKLLPGVKTSFIKFAIRKSIDFPIVNCAAAIETQNGMVKSARICLNAVYSNPYRVTRAEDYMKGKVIDEANAEAAGVAAVSDAIPLPYNKFKIQIAKTMVKRAVLACK
jgi:NADPH-dependent glutamate synthase beta subunit-like oxidoreductase/CO/xanthine dehydrogenase FAD-binding subunit